MDDIVYVKSLVKNARKALIEFEPFDQKTVDAMVRDVAKFVFDNAEMLAEMAHTESRMGSKEYKIIKNRGKARIMWASLRGKKSMGIISDDEESGIIEIAKPVGVVGAVQPCTNPIVTPMANVMNAIKGKNSIILAAHPRSVGCTDFLVKNWNKLLEVYNAPGNLIQFIEDGSLERTTALMREADVVVATGGPGMVRAAYSGGKPSFGVGPGNVQVIIDRDVNIKETVRKVIDGRIFDNGIICAGEQTMILPGELYTEAIKEVQAYGGYLVEKEEERTALIELLFPEGKLNKYMVGQTVQDIAAAAKISMPLNTKVIVMPEENANKNSPLRKEKMFPVITPFSYTDFSEAIDIAIENLSIEGKGHTVAVHSNNPENIKEVGLRCPVSRVVVNQTSATTAGGSFVNGLNPTSTLGCGSWGNNSISENFYYKHLLNITRIARVKKNSSEPDDDDLWNGDL
ncbi:MAG: aldehyde dehydrogenase family protein [Bacteroidetes bacterium]|nr:aldehyde dehydrogenase family protein [Bacteroidota bacterium]